MSYLEILHDLKFLEENRLELKIYNLTKYNKLLFFKVLDKYRT